MLRKKISKYSKHVLMILCMVLVLGIGAAPLKAEASWLQNTDQSIYDSGVDIGIGDLDEEAEEMEIDEGTNFFAQTFETVFVWFFGMIGNLLFGLIDTLGASLDVLIFGRIVDNDTIFTFALSDKNIYGIVSAAIYSIMSTTTVLLLIPAFMGKIVISTWKKGDLAKATLKDAITYFAFALLLILLMPYLLDVALFVRDNILYAIGNEAATNLFGSNNPTSIVSVLAVAASEDVVSAVIYDAAVVLNLYFLVGYVGIALSMAANFILFPIIVLKMAFDKSVLKNWVWEMVSCMLVPVIDALLIMIPSFVGVYSAELTGLENISVAIVQLIICYMIIPIRAYARQIVGIKANPLESTGLASARSLLGAAGGLALKKAFDSEKEAKKNAQADRDRADMEEDMAKLDEEQREKEEALAASRLENADVSTASADDIKREADRRKGIENFDEELSEDMNNELKNPSPLGKEQTYADGLEAHIASEEEDLKDVPLPEEAVLGPEERLKNAKKREKLDDKLEKTEEELKELQDAKNAILNDDSLTTEEKAEKLEALDKAIDDKNQQIDELNNEREQIMSIDDKIRAANKRKSQLEEEWHEVANDPRMPQNEKEQKLNDINDQIKEVSDEISGLQSQKMKMHLEQEKEALSKEPATLRKELSGLKESKASLDVERDDLVRQRDALLDKQANHAVGTAEHAGYEKDIQNLNNKIATRDSAIADNLIHQNTINSALKKQEAGLYDRQAYNLHERIKAQEDYNSAKADADYYQHRLDEADKTKNPLMYKGSTERNRVESNLANAQERMKSAENRLSSLSHEDRRIADRINEISPEKPPYTIDELKAEKTAQGVKRSAIQKEIAQAQYEMACAPDGDDKAQYRAKIAKLQSEVADCNYKSAKIDQMIEGMSSTGGSKAGAGASVNTKAGAIQSEYDRKRAAIMERYANIDNFESPQFAGISRERKAELYRERAMRTQKVFTSRKVAGALGAVAGAAGGLWLGSTGVSTGAILGAVTGSEVGERITLSKVEGMVRKPVDYSNKPIDFKVSADLRDNTYAGQERTYERVRAELRDSLSNQKFEKAVQQEILADDIVNKEIKNVFRKHHITKDNYAAKRQQILNEVNNQVINTVENAELRIIERCAGQEYAKMGKEAKQKIIKEVGKPNYEVFTELTENVYLSETWQPHYEEYLNND